LSLEPCTRVLLGGTIIDGTGHPPIKDSIVVMKGEYIIAVGKKSKIPVPDGAEVYDVTGMTVLPGLIDSHCHFYGMGVSMTRDIQLRNTTTLAETMDRLKEQAKKLKKGEWILGKGWDDSKWTENRYPTKVDLDAVSKIHPIMIVRICGHMVILNSLALKTAGITSKTPQPEGGQVDIGLDGEPTGVLRDCRQLIEPYVPVVTDEMAVDGLLKASDYALSLGCTSIQDAGLGGKQIHNYQQALSEGKLKIRTYLMLSGEAQKGSYDVGITTGFGNDMIKIGSTKLLMDGSLGARTAYLFEPYTDEPTTKGFPLIDPNELKERAKTAHMNDSQLAIHAIGDLAIDLVIDAIQYALKSKPKKNHRHRIEHCEILTAGQIERIQELGIIPAVQPNFVGEWAGPGSMYEQRLGPERNKLNNPYRYLIDEGVTIAFGSDGMPFNPIYGIWSAVNHGIKHSRIKLVEAVKCYTLNGAYASFEENLKGSIEPGKLADIAVFDRDLTETPPEEIRNAKAYMTLVGGKILYHKGF
jgi:predicted amidohydrolase YtcJ